MARINSSTFDFITLDGKTYNHDVYILTSGVVEPREHSHTFDRKQVEHILEGNPEVAMIEKGVHGYASLNQKERELLEEKGIKIVEEKTGEIGDKFNRFSENKKVAAIIHITC